MTQQSEGQDDDENPAVHSAHGTSGLALLALGVVFGDIGTSPLYAFREAFIEEHNVAPLAVNVLGVLSLIFWSLIIVITIKYLVFILRADNRGEGGILALTSLVTPSDMTKLGARRALIIIGLFGTALLFGDGMITPAISVLSAVEGLSVVTPALEPFVIPITIGILIALFAVQKHGTANIGRIFGPVTLVWFIVIALLGIMAIIRAPEVLAAINPLYGLRFMLHNGFNAFLVLGSVFLVVTGGEALYADMGHFGARTIRMAWFGIVLPALLLNYFGQGALLIHEPEAVSSPFYHLAPSWALLPLVVLATAATVIASQALISGVFSLTRQAVQLGYWPRVVIDHTSATTIGQIYVPAMNWALLVACVALVIGFGSSSALAAAYGVAVTTSMVATTLLFCVFARERWKWSRATVLILGGTFLTVDLAFCAANLLKIPSGGWFPLVVGILMFTLMTTWKTGRRVLAEKIVERTLPRDTLLDQIESSPPARVRGTAVFMYSTSGRTPPALLHNLKHNQVLHERVVLLSVTTLDVPYVRPEERIDITTLRAGFYEVVLRAGFMEDVNVPSELATISHNDLKFSPMMTSYFLGRETLVMSRKAGMQLWRQRLFTFMSSNARPAGSYFGLPPNRVVELGALVEL